MDSNCPKRRRKPKGSEAPADWKNWAAREPPKRRRKPKVNPETSAQETDTFSGSLWMPHTEHCVSLASAEVDDAIGQTRDSIGTLREEKDALEERCSRAEAEVARLKAELAGAASAWEKEKAEVASLKAEQAHAASAWEKEKAEVARLKGAASAWEKEKSELEWKVEHLEDVLAGELYFQKEKERYEGLLQELKGQMQVAKVEREQAILALYEVESRLGRRYKVGKSASEWKIPEHLTLPPSDTVLSTIRNSQAFGPFRRQIEKEIREHLMKEIHEHLIK